MDSSTKVQVHGFTSSHIVPNVHALADYGASVCGCIEGAPPTRPCMFAPVTHAQDIVKLVVDEGDTTFRRKQKLPDAEPDTGSPIVLAQETARVIHALQAAGSCCTVQKLRYQAQSLHSQTNCS